VAYVLGAFQCVTGVDNDPDTEDGIPAGVTTPTGGSLSFLENIEDYGRESPVFDADTLRKDNVVHEVGHAVARSLIDPPTKLLQGEPSRYTEYYENLIRTAEKPLSP
jgi:hypothetical protein